MFEFPEFLPKLHTLVLTNNRLVNLVEIDPLASFPKLQFLSLLDNNITKKPNYRLYVIHKLKSLRLLDFKKVKHKVSLLLPFLFLHLLYVYNFLLEKFLLVCGVSEFSVNNLYIVLLCASVIEQIRAISTSSSTQPTHSCGVSTSSWAIRQYRGIRVLLYIHNLEEDLLRSTHQNGNI